MILQKEIIALESAIATLEMLFHSIEFNDEEQAHAIYWRLFKAEKRLNELADLCKEPLR